MLVSSEHESATKRQRAHRLCALQKAAGCKLCRSIARALTG